VCLRFEGGTQVAHYGNIQMVAKPVEKPWQDGYGGMANSHNFQRRGSSLSPSLIVRLWQFLAFTQQKQLLYIVHIHTALGGGGPMDQGCSLSMLLSPHLNGEMLAESSLAGGNCNGGIQLRPDDGGALSLAGDGQWRSGGSVCTALDSKFCDFCICFCLFHIRHQ
jgi:hypothetical protein